MPNDGEKLYQAVKSGRVKLTDLNEQGKQVLREYMGIEQKPVKIVKSKGVSPIAFSGGTAKTSPIKTDRYTGSNPILQKAQSALDVVNRLGQKTADTLLLTDRTKYGGEFTPVATKGQETATDIGGLVLGSVVPYSGIYKGLGALEATSKAAQKLTPLARTGVKGGIAGGAYETAYGIGQEKPPEEIAKWAAIGTGAGALGDVAITRLPQLIRAAREANQMNAIKRLDLTRQYPQLPPPPNAGLIPEFASDPAGIVRARGRVGQPALLPMTQGEAVARQTMQQQARVKLLPGQVDTTIYQGAAPQRVALPMTRGEEMAREAMRQGETKLLPGRNDIIWQDGMLERKLLPEGRSQPKETPKVDIAPLGQKEPWQMTRNEYGRAQLDEYVAELKQKFMAAKKGEIKTGPFLQYKSKAEAVRKIKAQLDEALTDDPFRYTGNHLSEVNKALREGKSVPEEVLKEYGLETPEPILISTAYEGKADLRTPGQPTLPTAELNNARNILKTTKDISKAEKILRTFPELRNEFKGWTRRVDLKAKRDQAATQKPTLKPKPPAPAEPAELNAARNILKNTKNIDRAAKVLDTYPELKPQFKGWTSRINRAQAARIKTKPSLTPKFETPVQPPELQNARNILKATQNPQRAQRILDAYPQLKLEFSRLVKQLEKPVAKPKVKAAAVTKTKQAPGTKKEVPKAKVKSKPKPAPEEKPVKKVSLRDIEQQAGKAVDETIEPARPAVGQSVRIVGKGKDAAKAKESPHKFSDPAVEARFNKANGVPKEPLLQRTRNAVRTLINRATREFEYLPRTGEFSPLRYELSRLQKQRGVTSDRTLRLQQYILLNQDKAAHDLFRRKVILDDLVNTEGDLPFGFTQESLQKELAKINTAVDKNQVVKEAVQKRKQVWEAIKQDYIDAAGEIGFDMSERFNRRDYYRHQILEYMNAKERRGYLKKRLGSTKDINTNYLQAEYEVMAQMLHDIEVAKAMKKISDKYNIRPRLEKNLPEGKTLSETIPAGYTKWQPRQGGLFYLADSIPFRIADRLYRTAMDELGLGEKELKRALVKNGQFDYWVVKQEVADTLDGMLKNRELGPIAEFSKELQRKWKVWTLISPRRWFKYNVRNITGDADAVFAGNPSAFKKLPQATKELYQVIYGDRAMTPAMRDWFERGGMQTLLQAQELGELNNLKMFVQLMEKKGSLTEIPGDVWRKYWTSARMSTDFREAMLRYASYLDYLEQMKASGGRPKNFGASIPEEVMALDDIKDRAFKLSNELLGAYDQVGVIGQNLRDHLVLFWSWNEVNFRRYKQLWLNAANNGELAHTLGRKLMSVVPKSPMMAYNAGKLAAKATALWVMLDVWNNTVYPELEAGLSEEERNRPHIVLGKNNKGETIYFGRLGALQDFVDWFGVDAGTVGDIRDILNGKRSVKEVIAEMSKEPANKFIQGVTPFYKTTGELLTGLRLFPDAFKPGQIRDKWLHAFQSLGLENEYKEVMGLPSKPYKDTLGNILAYTQDPEQTSYYAVLDEKYRFMEKINKGGQGFFQSPRSNALYNFKMALRYEDKEAAKKYLTEYIALGGTGQGLKRSLKSMHPLYGLNKNEQIAFIKTLDKEQKHQLKQALQYYSEVLGD